MAPANLPLNPSLIIRADKRWLQLEPIVQAVLNSKKQKNMPNNKYYIIDIKAF